MCDRGAHLLGDLQIAAVQYVLDSVVAALEQDPNRKFIYVEQVFIAESCSGSLLHSCAPVVAPWKCLLLGVMRSLRTLGGWSCAVRSGFFSAMVEAAVTSDAIKGEGACGLGST